jgi:hypothetical protein
MNRDEKRKFNDANENEYYFAHFTQQRRELRKQWATSRKDWNHFLYDAEKKHKSKIKA